MYRLAMVVWIALPRETRADDQVTKRFAVAVEPYYFADAAPLAPRDAGVVAAIVAGAIDAVGCAPVRLWGHS